MNKILVTGAAGFIGSHVVDHCISMGLQVVATDDLSGGFLENIPLGCEFVQGDLRDEVFISNLFLKHNISMIYHLGAYAAEGLWGSPDNTDTV